MINREMLDSKQLQLLDELKGKNNKRILFVCLGNICRSPAAEGVMRAVVEANGDEARWEIDSSGMGGWHVGDLPDQRMRIHARQRGYDLVHRCRLTNGYDFDVFDLIVYMDSANRHDLEALARRNNVTDLTKLVPMAAFVDSSFHRDSIPDPYYDGAEGFELVLDLLENGCQNLYDCLK